MKYRLLTIGVLLLAVVNMTAQTIYLCDFENEVENAGWKLNVTANPSIPFANKWYIGTGISNGGEKSLYISTDGGQTPGYSSPSMMIATRSVTLAPGDYELSFDWLAGKDKGADALYVAWVPENVNTNSSQNGVKPIFLNAYALSSDSSIPVGEDSLRSTSWKISTFPIKNHDGSPYKLVFVWVNTTINNSTLKGACIDNIAIIPEDFCDKPEDLTLANTGNVVTFSWSGNAPVYEVKYYSYDTDEWSVINNISGNSVSLPNMEEGAYDFYVRSVCDAYQSRWTNKDLLVYFPNTKCIDYLTLTDQNCWIGNSKGTMIEKQKIDNGPDEKSSRHTVNIVKGKYDSLTNNQLLTIPPGELASVRLGNWDVNSEGETIEYTYKVNAKDASVLVMKYAVVMNEPLDESHPEGTQSEFELKILHKGFAVNCAEAKFSANYDTSGDPTWYAIPDSLNNQIIWWKEWTTIGVNLKEYDGETLTIRVSTKDCAHSGHYGYAYFTLGCSDGEMDGIACGDDPTTEFIAPDGFYYRWYLPNNSDSILGRNQIFDVDSKDTLTYHCDIIFPKDTSCYFTLTASAVPRYPIAKTSYQVSHTDCKNIVTFDNISYVMTVNQVTKDSIHTDIPCDFAEWDFGDGETSNEYKPIHEYPSEGGTFKVKLKTGISYCTDSIEFEVNVPRIGVSYDTIPAYACLGNLYTLPNGQIIESDGLYNDTLTSIIGCDSITVYDVKFMETSHVEIYDTICYGDVYIYDEKELTESGDYTMKLENIYGCDSTVVLNLHVLPEITFNVQVAPELEGNDGEIILSDVPSVYTYMINRVENGPLTGLKSGSYEIILVVKTDTLECQSEPQIVTIPTSCLDIEITEVFSPVCPEEDSVLVSYVVHRGSVQKYNISFDDLGISAGLKNEEGLDMASDKLSIPFSSEVVPGNYVAYISFPGQICDTVLHVPFTILYSQTIINQRWDDVLGILNERHNGGYDFSGFQWYRNGIKLEGETKPYLFIPEKLSLDDIYSAELVRSNDYVTLFTCGFVPKETDAEIFLVKNSVQQLQEYTIKSSEEGRVRIYTTTGILLNDYKLTKGTNQFLAPESVGYYLLQINTQQDERIYYLRVTQ